MAKKSAVERELKRERLAKKYAAKRAALKAVIANRETTPEDRIVAVMKLAQLPRNSAPVVRVVSIANSACPVSRFVNLLHVVRSRAW